MKLQRSQQGFTMVSLAFFLVLLGFAVFTALKLLPVYTDAFAVKASVESLETERNVEYAGVLAVRNALLKRLGVNNVTAVGVDDISVTREDDTYQVEVFYEVRVPYMFNIDLVLTFENSAEVRAR